ncbi:MAG: glycosyltransferase [Blastocatellia bacterium]
MLPLTIWMNMPSFHQDDLFTRLAESGEIDLRVVFAKELTTERVRLGWNAGRRQYEHRTLGSRYVVVEAARLACRERERVHVVNGIWAEPAFAAALVALKRLGSRFIIYSEAPEDVRPRSVVKRRLRAAFGQSSVRGAAGVLAVSHFAMDFYRELGCAEDRLYPFGYFRAAPQAISISQSTDMARTEIVFAGQLIRRKGVDVLLDALRPLFAKYANLHLTLIGDGEARAAMAAQVDACGLHQHITFTCALPAAEAQRRMAAADLLVLPSRWDGWGMVINEALASGVPVIASDACGASDLIRQGTNGYVFPSGDAGGLRDCLREFCNQSHGERAAMRRAARATGETIAADRAARYLIDCLKHATGVSAERPRAPWLEPARIEATGH